EARHQEPRGRLRGDHRPLLAVDLRRGLHPRQPARAVPVLRAQAVRAEGRVLHRAGRHAGPGADDPRGRRAHRRHRQGRAQGGSCDRHHVDRPRVRRHRPHRRHRAAASEDRPEGHVPRAQPGLEERAVGQAGLRHPGQQHAARRQPGRDPRGLRRRHALLRPAAARRRGQGPQGQRQEPPGGPASLRADLPRPRRGDDGGQVAPRGAAPPRQLAPAPQHRTRQEGRRPRAARLLLVSRLPRDRVRAPRRVVDGAAAAGGTQAGELDAQPGRDAGQRARADVREAASRRPRARPRQPRHRAVRARGGAPAARRHPPVRARAAPARPRPAAGGGGPGGGRARADALLQGPQPLLQHVRLQQERQGRSGQGGPRRGLPLLHGVARPPGQQPLLLPGRARHGPRPHVRRHLLGHQEHPRRPGRARGAALADRRRHRPRRLRRHRGRRHAASLTAQDPARGRRREEEGEL
ncbi:MAG: hypothetical protein AVDCRST_MAG85-3355, partial [uncultured Solirubrobacteraceae bacterium]